MTVEGGKEVFTQAGYEVHRQKDLQYGVHLRLISPQIVNILETGTVQIQGKPPVNLRERLGQGET